MGKRLFIKQGRSPFLPVIDSISQLFDICSVDPFDIMIGASKQFGT